MAFSALSDQEKDAVRQCLNAILDGPFIDDWEFHARLGLDRKTLKQILGIWPQLNDAAGSPAQLAINNCMNEVCHGVQISSGEWKIWFTATGEDVLGAYQKWARLAGYSSAGIR